MGLVSEGSEAWPRQERGDQKAGERGLLGLFLGTKAVLFCSGKATADLSMASPLFFGGRKRAGLRTWALELGCLGSNPGSLTCLSSPCLSFPLYSG